MVLPGGMPFAASGNFVARMPARMQLQFYLAILPSISQLGQLRGCFLTRYFQIVFASMHITTNVILWHLGFPNLFGWVALSVVMLLLKPWMMSYV